jgi:hypothetical protein
MTLVEVVAVVFVLGPCPYADAGLVETVEGAIVLG